MSKRGIHQDAGYGLVSKDYALFGTLSLKARGLYALLVCWPHGERLSVSAVLRVVPDGREAVTNAWRELEKVGLIAGNPKKQPSKFRETMKNAKRVDVRKPEETQAIFGETTKVECDAPIVLYTQESISVEESSENDRAMQLRKTSVGTLEAFMALKVARDADAAGIDVAHYFNAILEWSNKKNRQLRTAHGWVDTIKGAIRRDKQAGKLKMKGQAESQQEDQLRYLQIGR
jgi:hypothetical protein